MKTDLRHFIGRDQIHVLNCNMRGEEGEYFKQMLVDLKVRIEQMPHTYQARGDNPMIWLHYFARGSMNWWVAEKDMGSPDDAPGEEQSQAWGLADLYGDGGEWGYIPINEIIANGGEMDLYWKPRRLREEKCDHNEMVETGDPEHAWKCAKCGHVYGSEAEALAAMEVHS